MKLIQEADLAGKKVLIRADFNVELKDGDVKEKFKIAACKETVDHILSHAGAKVALISHLGRPDGKIVQEFSLSQIADDIERILERKVVFAGDCIGAEVAEQIEGLPEKAVLLLENVRFYPGEEANDEDFSRQLSIGFDVFINEAFSVSHRNQSSVTGITKHLPSYAGFWLQKEVDTLCRIVSDPKHIATAIIGGAKVETKLPLIRTLERSYDHILVGGRIANEALDQHIEFSDKVVLPSDFADPDRTDIGPETIEDFKTIIARSNTIIWNGPMGKFEEKPFDNGTLEILRAVATSGAYVLVGGGESVEVLEENGLLDSVSFVSTGGGAMLEYLGGNLMPGIEALN